jgi:hypothetical protein
VNPQDSALFPVSTLLGFSVRTTTDYWALIEAKHPKLRGRLSDVAQVLRVPEEIRRSQHDLAVYLFYRADQRRYLCAVVKRMNGEGFLITAYPCDKIKEGDVIWPKSK